MIERQGYPLATMTAMLREGRADTLTVYGNLKDGYVISFVADAKEFFYMSARSSVRIIKSPFTLYKFLAKLVQSCPALTVTFKQRDF
tara:strand:- start:40 stop:300 length:261 start_codon:yes stop_codon:yes gene_type:complete